ncbi:NAD(P)/FAD-dependent oxidoreductase [Saccharothrix yanglingensis]|uniref:NAD(P)/FAD-dependent oxidoreductase n=1 Tax=Saccharothrix yanglingensis TaxID=659496 RepID=UPI0027D2F02A|nr:FAD-dependent oxidoreductase [Saccharothrix yanglingensis]
MKNEERVVVAGGGLAGLRAGERLRELGFRGEIVIVSAERHLPYHRPALSKEAVNGELNATDLRLTISRELNAVWRLNTAATHLEPDRHVVGLPGGEELKYDGLVIATGVEPRHLAGAPRQDARIHVLRTVDDAIAIKQAINSTQGLVVVVGGGLIGCEMAASVKTMGRDVAIVSRSSTLLGSAVGKNIADTVTEAHRVRGVRMAMGVKIRHWVRQAGGVAIHLSDGQVFFAAVVVIAVGASPSIHWLRGSGLVLEDGVLCDPTCHVVGAADIVAAGDVARWPNLRFGGQPRRVEHWLNAVEMGRAAAENLLAGRQNSRPFTPVPRFWTEQYGMRIQGSGLPSMGKDTTTLAGSQKDHRTITGFVDDGRLVGMVGLDAPTAMIKLSTELWRQNRVAAPGPQRRSPQHLVPPGQLTEPGREPPPGRYEERPTRFEEPARAAVPAPPPPPGPPQAGPAPAHPAPAQVEWLRYESDRVGAGPAGTAPPPPSYEDVATAYETARWEAARMEGALLEVARREGARVDGTRFAGAAGYDTRAHEEAGYERGSYERSRHEAEPTRFERPAGLLEPDPRFGRDPRSEPDPRPEPPEHGAGVPRRQQESQPLPVPPHAPVVRTRSNVRPLVRTGRRARPR